MTKQAGTSNINRSYAGYLVDMGQKRRRSKKSETKRIKNGKERGQKKERKRNGRGVRGWWGKKQERKQKWEGGFGGKKGVGKK